MTILDRIVEDTRALVARRKANVTQGELEARPFFHGPTLSLAPALRHDELAIIAEIKQASPSKGMIRPDLDVPTIARAYKSQGASAVSVLTEPLHFQGSLDNLAQARQTVDLPLLRKDFIVDPYQIVEARAYGADAVLLIATVLDTVQLRDLHQTAEDLDLSCLVEVYDVTELDKLDFDQVQVLGVNNRDLRTFEVDLDHAPEVFARVPDHVVKVAESGLRTARDLAYLRQRDIDAVLIGETFMRASEPGVALAALRRETARLLRAERLRLAS
jgi:indole-3-glycerol phosphate synthase